jgi:hypothetical protein
MKKAIVYYTDNKLQWALALKCRNVLLHSAGDIPIISVSQKPIIHPAGFGKNICICQVGRSMLNMYSQILEGLKYTDADVIYLSEHDVLYTREHFEYTPEKDTFFYNSNLWFLDWNDRSKRKGMYFPSMRLRPALSQLVCYKAILIKNIEKRVELLKSGCAIRRGISGTCEPGICDKVAFVQECDETVTGFDELNKQSYFTATQPNVDIRNGQNFTGSRRVKESRSTYALAPWGEFKL